MKKKKILLGVDPFAELNRLPQKQTGALETLFKDQDILIEPIYVVNPKMLSWSEMMEQRGWEEYEKSLKEKMAKQLAKTGIASSRLLAPAVVLAPSVTTRGQVTCLLEYAKQSHCDLIVVSSHSRKGIKRVFLGSFAETLSVRTDLPLLVINPRQRSVTHQLHRVLFPTDLSDKSKRGLDSLIASMKGMWKKVILFHQVEPILSLAVDPFTGIPLPLSQIEKELKRRKLILAQWARHLRRKGIGATFEMNEEPASVAAAILTAVKITKAGMIAMVSEAGPLESAFLGSTTRKVMRASAVPVWTIHVRSAKEARTPVGVSKERRVA